ncbi:phage late control D family protein [Methanosarcina sp.]|uniref:phage late control D family protein n=1 Tax=Methanosarcina sp. TaxID=2213 RepID=UPI003C76CF47
MTQEISSAEIYAPAFSVSWADTDKAIPKNEITGLEVDEDLESPGMFRLSFNETFDLKTQQFRWLDDSSIAPGTMLIASFGYAFPHKESRIRGRIRALSPGFLAGGPPTLTVEGYDLSHDLKKTHSEANLNEVTYSDVAREIARKNKLDPSGVEDSGMGPSRRIERRVNEKDYDFLKRLADNLGFELFIRNRTLYFRKPDDERRGSMDFQYYKNIISFTPRMSAANVVNEVRVTAWNEKDKERISETAELNEIKTSIGIPGFADIVEESQGTRLSVKIEGRVVRSREEAKAIALSELKKRNVGFITGTLECVGNPELRPGITVNIVKVGERFSGVYYITKSRHVLGENGYRTTLEVRRCL